MEQRAVIRFFTLKGLPSRAIAAELKSVYAADALALPTVKKWRKRFAHGRTSLCDDPMSGPPLTNDLTEAITSILKERPFLSCKVLCRHFRMAKASCLRICFQPREHQQVSHLEPTFGRSLNNAKRSDRPVERFCISSQFAKK
jgi:transposase